MRHAKNGLAAKFTIFIFTRPFGVCVALASATKSEASPLLGADRAAALYSVDPFRIAP
jgi:hypothetical protein